ncbi:hypothetical protein AVEN_153252-1 [Araneus ventricosus]|uniref:Endonuclease/exonuclease/phosphatase domain-containing protein n=1 Tax=Araneus ventricosus TaxID=182803 RepID=A0A4Y2K2Q2_ARAVE|nr:hypothetical protein AVEN_153252-1 [Araneus ventricosus]
MEVQSAVVDTYPPHCLKLYYYDVRVKIILLHRTTWGDDICGSDETELDAILTNIGDEKSLIGADYNAYSRIRGYKNEDPRGTQSLSPGSSPNPSQRNDFLSQFLSTVKPRDGLISQLLRVLT